MVRCTTGSRGGLLCCYEPLCGFAGKGTISQQWACQGNILPQLTQASDTSWLIRPATIKGQSHRWEVNDELQKRSRMIGWWLNCRPQQVNSFEHNKNYLLGLHFLYNVLQQAHTHHPGAWTWMTSVYIRVIIINIISSVISYITWPLHHVLGGGVIL